MPALNLPAPSSTAKPRAPQPRRSWIIGEGGHWKIAGDKAGATPITGYSAHLLVIADLLKLTPDISLSLGGGLDYLKGGYTSSKDGINTDLSLFVLNGAVLTGITFTKPRFTLSAGIQYDTALASSLDMQIDEKSLFEINKYSSQNSLQDYTQIQLYARSMVRVAKRFWVGVYGLHTVSGNLKAPGVASEEFSGLQAGLALSYGFDWVLLHRQEEKPKPIAPSLPEDQTDLMKGLEQ
jgi:hypothetical protein